MISDFKNIAIFDRRYEALRDLFIRKANSGGIIPIRGVPRRAPTPRDALIINSGHSLTDVFFQSSSNFPYGGHHGWFRTQDGMVSQNLLNADFNMAKSTIPGSSTEIRWNATGNIFLPNNNARTDIGNYDLLTITERGLDNTSVSYPYSLDNEPMQDQLVTDMEYLWKFIDNARLNGRNGGAESIIWAIWGAIDGSMGNFRTLLDQLEHRWHYRQEVINLWLKEVGETKHPYVYIIPGHRLMMRLYDDIQLGLVPGVTNISQFFSDNIHPNMAGVYAVNCLVYSVIFQKPTLGYMVDDAVTSLSPNLGAYLQNITWEIASNYARAGLGGTDMGAVGIWRPVELGNEIATIPGYSFDLKELSISSSGPVEEFTIPPTGGTGFIYGVMAITYSSTQQNQMASILQAYPSPQTGVDVLAIGFNGYIDGYTISNDTPNVHAAQSGATRDEVNLLEFWLTPTGGTSRGISNPQTATGLTTQNIPANRIRFGQGKWGVEKYNAQIHALALFNEVPTSAQRMVIRNWAYENAGIQNPELRIQERPV